MRPFVFFSIATAKRFIHSCWASLRVAVASLMVMGLSWAAAPPANVAISAAASENVHACRANRALMEKLVIGSPRDAARVNLIEKRSNGAPVTWKAVGLCRSASRARCALPAADVAISLQALFGAGAKYEPRLTSHPDPRGADRYPDAISREC